jgi:aspartyl-tRNA synthetase
MAKRGVANANVEDDFCAGKYGDREIIRSQCDPNERLTKIYTQIKDIDDSFVGKDVLIRCRLHNTRGKGKLCFCVLRESFATIQLVLSVGDTVSKGMVAFA